MRSTSQRHVLAMQTACMERLADENPTVTFIPPIPERSTQATSCVAGAKVTSVGRGLVAAVIHAVDRSRRIQL